MFSSRMHKAFDGVILLLPSIFMATVSPEQKRIAFTEYIASMYGFVFYLRWFDHVSAYRGAVKTLSMETFCRILICCMNHNVCLDNEEPQYTTRLSFMTMSMSSQGSSIVFHDRQLHFLKIQLDTGKRRFSYFGPQLHNNLPEQL